MQSLLRSEKFGLFQLSIYSWTMGLFKYSSSQVTNPYAFIVSYSMLWKNYILHPIATDAYIQCPININPNRLWHPIYISAYYILIHLKLTLGTLTNWRILFFFLTKANLLSILRNPLSTKNLIVHKLIQYFSQKKIKKLFIYNRLSTLITMSEDCWIHPQIPTKRNGF